MLQRPNPSGFTLIEVMAAIVIMGLLSAAVVVNLAGRTRAARAEDVVGRIEQYDSLARAAARRTGAADVLTVDLTRGEIRRSGTPMFRLGDSVKLARLLLPGRRIECGVATAPISLDGRSPSYAVKLEGPNGEARWLFFAGLTGTPVHPADDREAEELFDKLLPDPTQ